MELLFPQFLFGFLALAIPIIIHLFNFRRYKRVDFPTTRFLKEVQEESKRKSQLKHLLILLSRLLLVSSLVLAFCQPIIPINENFYRPNVNAIVVDNSYSMDVDIEGGRAFDIAKNAAFELVKTQDDDAQFMIYSANYGNEANELLSKRESIERIKNLESSSAVFNMNGLAERIAWYAKDNELNIQSYYFTDLQQGSINESIAVDSNSRINIIKLEKELSSNISIDSCWFQEAVRKLNQSEKLYFKASNFGNEEREVEFKLEIDSRNIARKQIAIPPNTSIIESFNFSVANLGNHRGNISVEDAPVDFDNRFFFNYKLESEIPILYISESKDSLFQNIDKLYKSDSSFVLTHAAISKLDIGSIAKYPLIILAGVQRVNSALSDALKRVLESGSSLCIIPPSRMQDDSYNQFLNELDISPFGQKQEGIEKVSSIQLESKFYEGVFESIPKEVDLPYFKSHYKTEPGLSLNSSLMTLIGGDELLSEAVVKAGTAYIFRASLNESNGNFSRHALFVPSFLQMAINSRKSFQLYSIISDKLLIEKDRSISSKEGWFLRSSSEDSSTFIPAITNDYFIIPDFQGDAGYYNLMREDSNIQYSIAINENRKESNLNTVSEELIIELGSHEFIDISSIKGSERPGSISSMHKHTELWKVFVLLALLFAAIEIILIKFLN